MESFPITDILNQSVDNLEDEIPPADFDHVYTPKPPKLKLRAAGRGRSLMKLLQRGAEALSSPKSSPKVETNTRVSFKEDEDIIPIGDAKEPEISTSSEDMEESDWTETESIEPEVNDNSDDSAEYMADKSADEEVHETSTTRSAISEMIKNFVLVDVGPNISDTVHEFTNLLSDVAISSTRRPTAKK